MSKQLPFSMEEFQARLTNLRMQMAEHEVELLIVDQAEFLFYVTGFAISASQYRACLVTMEGEPVMVLRNLDAPLCRRSVWFERVVGFDDSDDPFAVIAKEVEALGYAEGTLALDLFSYTLTVQYYQSLQRALPDANWVDFSGVLPQLRAEKSAAEFDYLRKAAAIADQAMEKVQNHAATGGTPRDSAAVAASVYYRLGADPGHVGPIAIAGKDDHLHAALADTPLKEGDILHAELVPKVKGYCARIMRPTYIGDPPGEVKEKAELIVRLQDKQYRAMVPGALAAEVDAVLREGMLQSGLKQTYTNITGYTLGYYFIHSPRSSDFSQVFLPQSEWTLQENMVFHMYTVADGLAFSDTVRVTGDGGDPLTKRERKLHHT